MRGHKELTRYQWFVLGVCCVGWMFDTMAQQIFNLARKSAIHDLMGAQATDAMQGAYATSIFMLGWPTGGIIFGILGDRIGRVKTMVWTILCYTLFTGLQHVRHRHLGLQRVPFPLRTFGVGGQFSVGVALVAEVAPERARPYMLGTLQSFSSIGNMLAATVGILLGQLERTGVIHSARGATSFSPVRFPRRWPLSYFAN